MKKLAGILVLLASGGVAGGQTVTTTGQDARAAIAYWTTGYAGAELGDVGCPAPAIAGAPQDRQEIWSSEKAIRQWQDCHRRVIAALGPAHVEKYIPADVLASMTLEERTQALRHVVSVHGRIAEAVQAQAVPVIAHHDAWRSAAARMAEQLSVEASERLAASRDKSAAWMTSGERAEQARNERRSVN